MNNNLRKGQWRLLLSCLYRLAITENLKFSYRIVPTPCIDAVLLESFFRDMFEESSSQSYVTRKTFSILNASRKHGFSIRNVLRHANCKYFQLLKWFQSLLLHSKHAFRLPFNVKHKTTISEYKQYLTNILNSKSKETFLLQRLNSGGRPVSIASSQNLNKIFFSRKLIFKVKLNSKWPKWSSPTMAQWPSQRC